ncbi:MAG: glycosyltransferase family 25 protein [Gammaproteobacteria bacterium]|nr:glycosyltransferase family 25 protein [Gammaproteobacteria bacterium]
MNQTAVYVISLPWAKQRRDRISAQLESLGIKYEIVDAIDGNFLSPYDLLRHKMHLISKFKSRLLTPGEQGATLSHHKIYELMIKRNDKHALILEDDVLIDEKIKLLLDNPGKLTLQWNICYLGYFHDTLGKPFFRAAQYPIDLWGSKQLKLPNKQSKQVKQSGRKLRVGKFILRPRGAFGYMLTQKAARLLLQKQTTRRAALIADRALSNAAIPGLVGIAPALITHDNSQVEECITLRPSSNFEYWTLNRDLNRMGGLAIRLVPFLKPFIYLCRDILRRCRATCIFLISRQYNRFRRDYEV